MTQAPFRRLVLVMGAVLAVRLGLSVGLGLVPWWQMPRGWGGGQQGQFVRAWTLALLVGRYFVGLATPLVLTWMTYDCVKRRANQSATGILYVACVLVLMGEGLAMAIGATTGKLF